MKRGIKITHKNKSKMRANQTEGGGISCMHLIQDNTSRFYMTTYSQKDNGLIGQFMVYEPQQHSSNM